MRDLSEKVNPFLFAIEHLLVNTAINQLISRKIGFSFRHFAFSFYIIFIFEKWILK